MKLRVCALYPELMNIYADRGNLQILRSRCEWRGIGFELTGATIGDSVDPEAHDFFYMGGGQDRDQALCAQDLVETKKDALSEAAQADKVMLAVCGGFQLFGFDYQMGDETLPGIGLFAIHTRYVAGSRLIGNTAVTANIDGEEHVIAGFVNHGGRTFRDTRQAPFGTVIKGYGNNDDNRDEGAQWKNVFGTYLHGPLLPKNVFFADKLIELALGTKLDPLPDDSLERAAHESARRAAGV
jgi:lipid II isoglutaminyl synthase (glutamine-hydrolysing)